METAVPDDVITAAGLLAPRPYPTAWNARDLSSMHEVIVTRGFAAAAAARGDDREPGAMQKYCTSDYYQGDSKQLKHREN